MIPKPAVDLAAPALVADLRQFSVEARRSVPSTVNRETRRQSSARPRTCRPWLSDCRIADTTIELDPLYRFAALKNRLQRDFLINPVARAAWSIDPELFGPLPSLPDPRTSQFAIRRCA